MKEFFFNAIFSLLKYSATHIKNMDYKKKSLRNLNRNESYEEIDTRLASGWYVDEAVLNKKKKYKTQQVTFKVVKKNK